MKSTHRLGRNFINDWFEHHYKLDISKIDGLDLVNVLNYWFWRCEPTTSEEARVQKEIYDILRYLDDCLKNDGFCRFSPRKLKEKINPAMKILFQQDINGGDYKIRKNIYKTIFKDIEYCEIKDLDKITIITNTQLPIRR